MALRSEDVLIHIETLFKIINDMYLADKIVRTETGLVRTRRMYSAIVIGPVYLIAFTMC